VKTDVTFYGGIYRDVWLRVSEPVYLSTVYWTTPRVSQQSAEVAVHATVTNTTSQSKSLSLTHEVIDPAGKLVGTVTSSLAVSGHASRDVTQEIAPLNNPQLWSPDNPYLYRIRTSLGEAKQPIDSIEIPLGLRWFRFDAQQGFLLNGKRLQLQGLRGFSPILGWEMLCPIRGTLRIWRSSAIWVRTFSGPAITA